MSDLSPSDLDGRLDYLEQLVDAAVSSHLRSYSCENVVGRYEGNDPPPQRRNKKTKFLEQSHSEFGILLRSYVSQYIAHKPGSYPTLTVCIPIDSYWVVLLI